MTLITVFVISNKEGFNPLDTEDFSENVHTTFASELLDTIDEMIPSVLLAYVTGSNGRSYTLLYDPSRKLFLEKRWFDAFFFKKKFHL